MEIPPQGEKENNPISHVFLQNNSTNQPPTIQYFPNPMQKKSKPAKPKTQKGFSSNLRAGDWICLICNNLNFSFRNECNRCQIQTKEQNQMQTMYYMENSNIQNTDPQARLPFQDLTNQKFSQSKPGQPGLHNKSKSTPMQSEYELNLLSKPPGVMEAQGTGENRAEPSKASSSNKGFQNMLLVTPPKHRQNKSVNIFKEYSDSSQKELPPYRSPEHLPSISPILKKVFGFDFKESEEREEKLRNSLRFLKEENEDSESQGERISPTFPQHDIEESKNIKDDLYIKESKLKPQLPIIDELSYFQQERPKQNKKDIKETSKATESSHKEDK